MKTSNYLIVGFLIFFFGSITALHIDSKFYEIEYKEKRAKKQALFSIRNDFFVAFQTLKEDKKNTDKWDDFINKTKVYFSHDEGVLTHDINSATWYIYYEYKQINKLDALPLALKWAKKGVELSPEDPHMADTYANLLFDNGDVKEAIKYEQIAADGLRKQGHEWAGLYYNRLERFKAYLDAEPIEIGDKFIDVPLTRVDNDSLQLSNLIANKVALLTFWWHVTPVSVQRNKKLFPVYEAFKTKGFTVIGISKNDVITPGLTSWLNNNPTPWDNYIDFKNKNRVWDSYNVITTETKTILIDKDGTIIAMDPNVEELTSTLKTLLD